MRIAQLDLKAFGHFTGRRIRFAAAPDFHLAYGPNEAGKTTISRALRAVLFGIPERTGDNHLHANPNLRVGIVLDSPTGARLAAMRRKARKNSLVSYDPQTGEELSEPVADSTLAEWLGGLAEGLYTSMFGLDHVGLVEGGKALSEGKGELGQSLFEAGAGLSSVRALRERLAKEADALFRPRASTSAVYGALEQYSLARREARDAQTRPAEWETLSAAVDGARRAYDGARQDQEVLQREVRRLERLAAVLPDVAARVQALVQLAGLGEVVRLPADAAARRIGAQTRLRESERERAAVATKLAGLKQERDAIALPQAVLEEGGAIDALYYALDAFRTARDGAASAQGRIGQAEGGVASLLAAIGQSAPADPLALIPPATLRARVHRLATQGATLSAKQEEAVRQAAAAQRELDGLAAELNGLGARELPAAVAEALVACGAEANLETQAYAGAQQAAEELIDLARDSAALGFSSAADLADLAVPPPAQVQRLRVATEELEFRRQSLLDKIATLENDRATVAGELAGLLQRGEVPTAGQLAQQRALRDRLWQRIRCQVYPKPGQTPEGEPLPPPADYELAVQSADHIADARFTDAARVSQHAELHKRLAQMENALELERKRLAAVEQGRSEWGEAWQVFLDRYRLPALALADLADWLGRRELVVQRYQSYTRLEGQIQALDGRVLALRARLSAALAAVGLPGCGADEPLAQALARLRACADQAHQAAASYKILAQKQHKAGDRLAEASGHLGLHEQSLTTWQSAWAESMASLGIGRDAGPEEAAARLGQFEELARALAALEGARADLATARSTLERVEREAARLCQATGYGRANRPADAVAETLFTRLSEARTSAQRRQTLEDLIRDAEQAGQSAERALIGAQDELAALMSAAGCDTLDALVAAEGRSALCLQLESKVDEIETRLVLASALALPDLLAQAQGQDLALVKANLERASADLHSSTAHVEARHADLIKAQAGLDQVDGGAVAAEAEQRAAGAAARLASLAADYATARLASAILAEVIDAYQQRNQGPLLARASEIFAAITGGRFARVAADFDESMAILVAVRPSGQRLTVGSLSSGTRDQLFLALRLAAIESHVGAQEPMPVVVDDIVINFDDASADATFPILADLSRKTQVLFFTHHEHLLARAEAAIGGRRFQAHRL